MTQRRRYATRDELAELLTNLLHDRWLTTGTGRIACTGHAAAAKDMSRVAVDHVLDALADLGTPIDALVKITVTESP